LREGSYMRKTKLIYLLGKSENELLAYDEYDSEGSGKWFTDNPVMANEYYCQQACEDAEKEGLDVFLWEVIYDINEKKIIRKKIWLQFTNEEATKWKNDHY
jgi:hypothetical protein